MARRLFLERRTYRQNRLQDAARLLPVLALVLFFAPIFIRGEAEPGGPQLATWLVYYFAVWLGMIALTAFVSRSLVRGGEIAPEPDREEG
ncbi:MAG: hypothetical protein N4A39_12825 [Roseicyclus sp.]|jgi:hypothetical protein|nr:hypothetical protein [Roseicyclus sp.]